ncbi:SOS response-associated peptidase [Paraburkholderia sp. CNPSo 3272]|uniref:SOS response-associated peptidase family protein n=1 Tax=Paraburkholderia sp. CNPSo 3272 TaxID=2940931 RepID=UPI0020B6D810|nr:SOS response-associated peptidase family protein [Paraburkholderia sp. CNPSo 3272]MCP3722592.1 SOS response-associated peptidase [Paraburkholderia sp. CNPSo 3272]
MCYSAQIYADYRKFVRMFGAVVDIQEFAHLFFERTEGVSKAKVPKAMEDAFGQPETPAEREIKTLIDRFNSDLTATLEQDLFKQRKRLADAERILQSRATRAASESQRIATDKIETALRRIEDVNRTESKPRDSRIFPGYYAPVLVMENGEYVVRPMRYQCRIAGKPADYDVKFPGTYNARRDNLEGFWKPCFGHTHGVMLVEVFYENVKKAKMEGTLRETHSKDENVVLEFRPSNRQLMHVACLWSRWSKPGEPDLLSFAAITDEPPPEIEAAGHDRCIIPIKPENIEAWLNPSASSLEAMYAILDDKDRPYYEHKLAA